MKDCILYLLWVFYYVLNIHLRLCVCVCLLSLEVALIICSHHVVLKSESCKCIAPYSVNSTCLYHMWLVHKSHVFTHTVWQHTLTGCLRLQQLCSSELSVSLRTRQRLQTDTNTQNVQDCSRQRISCACRHLHIQYWLSFHHKSQSNCLVSYIFLHMHSHMLTHTHIHLHSNWHICIHHQLNIQAWIPHCSILCHSFILQHFSFTDVNVHTQSQRHRQCEVWEYK